MISHREYKKRELIVEEGYSREQAEEEVKNMILTAVMKPVNYTEDEVEMALSDPELYRTVNLPSDNQTASISPDLSNSKGEVLLIILSLILLYWIFI